MSVVEDWRLRGQRYRLTAEVCGDCRRVIFPPRDICPHCGSADTSTVIEYRSGVPRNLNRVNLIVVKTDMA